MLEAMELRQTYPWSWYVDEAVLRAEQERIFRRAWQYVGHAGQIDAPGSYFTGRAGLVPIVVTRDRDDELRAFVNVCRHRGFEVAQGEGRRGALQCGYHAWTYGLDGRLRAAPRADREQGFDPDQIKSHQARFSAPVFPGDTITVDLWKEGKEISFEARVAARNVTVIKNGLTVLR